MRWPSALTSKLSTHSLPVVGGGGAAAWLTSIASHRVSTSVLVAGTVIVCLTVGVHTVSKGMEWFYKHRKAIIDAQGTADEKRIKAESAARTSKTREETKKELLLKGVDDPAKAVQVERMLMAQAFVNLPEGCELRDEEFRTYAEVLAAYGNGVPLKRAGPDDVPGGEFRRVS